MNPLPVFPPEVHRYITSVFAGANRRICEKITRVPNCPEPSLDLTFIEHLTQYCGPKVVAPGWAVRIDVHYLGGLRHFHHRWEIADIGILVLAKRDHAYIAKKVALLQSKRLYPNGSDIIEETEEDFRIGFGNLLPTSSSSTSIALKHTYRFTKTSAYKALRVGDNQYKAIEAYETKHKIPVHYLLYNPWQISASYDYPIVNSVVLGRKGNGGCRIVASRTLRSILADRPKNYAPEFDDLSKAHTSSAGWRLEYFVSNLLMKCKEGELFESLDQENIFSLFNRRSGPIAAALAVTIEQFGN